MAVQKNSKATSCQWSSLKPKKSVTKCGTRLLHESDGKRPKRTVAPPRYYQQDLDEEEIFRRAIKQSLKEKSQTTERVEKPEPVLESVQEQESHPMGQSSSHKEPRKKISTQKLKAVTKKAATMKAVKMKAKDRISRMKAVKQRRLKRINEKPKSKTTDYKLKKKLQRKPMSRIRKKTTPPVIPTVDDFIDYVIQLNVCTPDPRLVALFGNEETANKQSDTSNSTGDLKLVSSVKSEKSSSESEELITECMLIRTTRSNSRESSLT